MGDQPATERARTRRCRGLDGGDLSPGSRSEIPKIDGDRRVPFETRRTEEEEEGRDERGEGLARRGGEEGEAMMMVASITTCSSD